MCYLIYSQTMYYFSLLVFELTVIRITLFSILFSLLIYFDSYNNRFIVTAEQYLIILIHPKISILLLVDIQIISSFKPLQKMLFLTFLGMSPGPYLQRWLWVWRGKVQFSNVQIKHCAESKQQCQFTLPTASLLI